MASVLSNNVSALAALGNGLLPLRKVAQLEAERDGEGGARAARREERAWRDE